MPWRVKKGRKDWLIQKKVGNRWKTVAHSDTEADAKASVRARYSGSKDAEKK